MTDHAGSDARKSQRMRASDQDRDEAELSRAEDRDSDLLSLLSRVVQRDIVPNLITANRVIGTPGAEPNGPAAARAVSADDVWHDSGFNIDRAGRDAGFASNHVRMVDVARFVRLLRGTGGDAAPALIDVLLSKGIPRGELYLELLAPAARMIGDLWQDDECSFAEVTMVVARLHQILNGLREERSSQVEPSRAPAILLSVAPGEQHSFGIAVVDAFFQDAGWRTTLSHSNDADELIEAVATHHFDAVGLSFSHRDLGPVLKATIVRLRAASANRDVVILVGGPAVAGDEGVCAEVGADHTVSAGLEGAVEAMKLLPKQRALHV
jgi:methanogenic corrinoid protein MtbC1